MMIAVELIAAESRVLMAAVVLTVISGPVALLVVLRARRGWGVARVLRAAVTDRRTRLAVERLAADHRARMPAPTRPASTSAGAGQH